MEKGGVMGSADWRTEPPERIAKSGRVGTAHRAESGLDGGNLVGDAHPMGLVVATQSHGVIRSSVGWGKPRPTELFEERFNNKEALGMRFNQLAELRNGIRHSRTVDAVTRKDGEASLHWFRQAVA